jgi:hypothetical protein
MTAFDYARARLRQLFAALRERFAPLPVDDEARIVGWVPDPIAIAPEPVDELVVRDAYPVTGHAENRESRIMAVRTAEATELVDQAEHLADPWPIYDTLVAELAQLEAAKLRALRTPTAEFWAIVTAVNGWHCEHCLDGDHTLCPGCECGCTLVAMEAQHATV